jgi:hypothetical protein
MGTMGRDMEEEEEEEEEEEKEEEEEQHDDNKRCKSAPHANTTTSASTFSPPSPIINRTSLHSSLPPSPPHFIQGKKGFLHLWEGLRFRTRLN